MVADAAQGDAAPSGLRSIVGGFSINMSLRVSLKVSVKSLAPKGQMCDTSDALRSETIWHLYFSGLCIIEQFVRNELPSENSTSQNRHQPSLDERFANRPRLRERLFTIADMIDQAVAEGCTAHQAEARAMEQVRQLGNDVLTDWAEKSEQAARGLAQ